MLAILESLQSVHLCAYFVEILRMKMGKRGNIKHIVPKPCILILQAALLIRGPFKNLHEYLNNRLKDRIIETKY